MDDTFLAGRSDARRLSDQERDDAVAALHRERAAGRLDDDELADRTRRAQAARTRGDLAPCFADLPEGEGPIADSAPGAPERPRSFAWLIVALSPFVAVAMFFITGFVFGGWTIAWLWYLLIPVAGIVSAAFGRR